MNADLETPDLETPAGPKAAEAPRPFSDLLTSCPECAGTGYNRASYPASMSLATALQYQVVKGCPTCAGRRSVPSEAGKQLLAFLQHTVVVRELAPLFAQFVPDPNQPGLEGIAASFRR